MSIEDRTAARGEYAAEPFLRLLYRYLWPFVHFRDVTRGQRLERQLNYRYNRELRVHLPGFAIRWAFLTALCFGVGYVLGSLPAPAVLTAFLFTTGAWALSVSLIVVTAWCWLTRYPELY
jgi:hypothetical protein